jgi:hypothetical protein
MEQNDLRIGVYLEGKLARAMRREKGKTLAAYAAIARAALVEYLLARGYDVEDTVEWGGPRQQADEREVDDQGQMSELTAA